MPIGPTCAVADVTGSRRSSTAARSSIQSVVTGRRRTARPPPNQVRVNYYEGSSSFGSAHEHVDTPQAAAILSQLVGAPVRLQFMRWDEHGWDNYGPRQFCRPDGRHRRQRQHRRRTSYNLMQSPYCTVTTSRRS